MAKVKKSAHKTKAGAEITPEIADALASEAERGYDLSKAKQRRVSAVSERARQSPGVRTSYPA